MDEDNKTKYTWSTRHSLLNRLQEPDSHQAWEVFVAHYRPFIYFLLNQMRINLTDQDDLVQEILLRLHENLGSYVKQKGKFRTWLGTVIKNVVRNSMKKQGRLSRKNNEFRQSLEVVDSYSQPELEKIIQGEWEKYIMDLAVERLKKICSQNVMDCFEMTLKNVPVEEISQKLNVKVDTVYMIRSRMKSRMLNEIQKIIRELEF